ncbi:hypothetical protein PV326_014268 [Microctonus aethiopoides]|nr:hypothetical protein PV326_014268 [Microctonus aethiopoides]
MDQNIHLYSQMMENHYVKSSNIHVNPMFSEPLKSVIHINPKVQLNMAIHVNPKMMNSLSTCDLQQVRQKVEMKQPISTTPIASNTLNVQKSVYVNPKLMKKLTTKVPDIIKKEQTQLPVFQPQILNKSTSIVKTKNILINKNSSANKKYSPSNFVSLSKSKLVRIRPGIKSTSINSTISPKMQKSTKIIDSNRLKKFTTISSTKLIANKSKNLPNNRYKIDRTKMQKTKINKIRISPSKIVTRTTTISRTNTASRANKNLIKIDGVLYKSSKSQLVKSTNSNRTSDQRKKVNITGNALKQFKTIRTSGKLSKVKSSITRTSINRNQVSNSIHRINYKHLLSTRAKQKSIQILRHKMTKNNQPCLLFQRFGYCAKHTAGTCPKVHDKKQVALCKNFLQGKCLLDNCPLSHDVGPEKMPTCKYFLDGCCIRDPCPYLHVKFSSNTPICKSFLQGYCAKGNKCKERHTNICPEFEKTGKCTKGKNCPYPHKSILSARRRSLQNSKTSKIFNKQVICNKKSEAPSTSTSREEVKKRYYDEDENSLGNLSSKRMKILDKIKLMKTVHNSELQNSQLSDSTVNIQNTQQQSEEHSQPSQNVQYKRPPIGPCPAYIPI